MNDYYILDEEGQPVAEPDVTKWAAWREKHERRVKTSLRDEATISTVFLGLDHGIDEDKPLLYETMIFGGEHDGYEERYCTDEEARAGHERIVQHYFPNS